MNNTEILEQIKSYNIKDIQKIELTSIGLLDVFGKLIVRVILKDNNAEEYTFISPVDITPILDYLKETNLIDISTLMKL